MLISLKIEQKMVFLGNNNSNKKKSPQENFKQISAVIYK